MKTAKLLNLEWCTAPGHYTFCGARGAAAKLGMRLPTKDELAQLYKLPSYWSCWRNGRYFGRHRWQFWKKAIFLHASGYIHYIEDAPQLCGIYGYYWSGSLKNDENRYYQSFGADAVYAPDDAYMNNKLSVVFVK